MVGFLDKFLTDFHRNNNLTQKWWFFAFVFFLCLIEVDDDQALTQMELDYDSFNESVDNNDDDAHDNKTQGMLKFTVNWTCIVIW